MGMANGRHRLTQIVDRSAHGHRLDVVGAGDRSVAACRRHATLLRRWRSATLRVGILRAITRATISHLASPGPIWGKMLQKPLLRAGRMSSVQRYY
jgi:hypothetical protein